MSSVASDPTGHVFISYVHEDATSVDRLQAVLESAGISVWRDTDRLWPGQDWRVEIRRAITDGSLVFIACFSDSSASRATSYQNEELVLAVEQMRLRPPGASWLIPVRFSDCQLPEFDLGAGRTLDSLQRVDLFDSWEKGAARLVAAILRVLGTIEGVTPEPAAAHGADLGRRLRLLLRDPSKDIDVEELVAETTGGVREQLQDKDEFPTYAAIRNDPGGYRFLAEQLAKYATVSEPAIEVLVPGCTWGLAEHEFNWTRLMGELANVDGRDPAGGLRVLLNMSRFTALVSLYAAGVASVHRGKFGNLRAVAVDPVYRSRDGAVPLIGAVHPGLILEGADMALNVLALQADGEPTGDEEIQQLISGRRGRRYTPLSDYFYQHLRPFFSKLIVDEQEYTETFDQLEALLGIIATDVRDHTDSYVPGAWFGAFTWRDRHSRQRLEQRLLDRLQTEGDEAPEVRAGLFGGSSERAVQAAERFAEQAAGMRQHQW